MAVAVIKLEHIAFADVRCNRLGQRVRSGIAAYSKADAANVMSDGSRCGPTGQIRIEGPVGDQLGAEE